MRRKVQEGVCEVDCVDPAAVAAAGGALPPEGTLREAAEAFQVLAHPHRLRILVALERRELCVCDVSKVLGVSMSGASQHLRELRRIGAVTFRVDGKLVYYTVADPFWLRLAESVLDRSTFVAGQVRPPRPPRRRKVPA